MKYFFVNQKTYNEEKTGNFIWAPLYNEKGKTLWHWDKISEIIEGNIIISNHNSKIAAICVAKSRAYASKRPKELEGNWQEDGIRVDLQYFELDYPFRFNQFKDEIEKHRTEKYYPFTKEYQANQIYMADLPNELGDFFLSQLKQNDFQKIKHLVENITFNNYENIIEEKDQFQKINDGIIKSYSDEELAIISSEKYVYKNNAKELINNRVKTDPKLKATRLLKSGYKCETNNMHTTFPASNGEHQYMECHHIIPLNAQKNYPHKKLDNMFNIIALCPICHAQIHYGSKDSKNEMFIKMYLTRKKEFESNGFTYNDLINVLEKYYIK